jgi:hypothetical protein
MDRRMPRAAVAAPYPSAIQAASMSRPEQTGIRTSTLASKEARTIFFM